MEIVLKDIDGNEILSPSLTQWDQGVSVIVRNYVYTAEQVHFHFYNKTQTKIVEVQPKHYEDNTGAPCLIGPVPNILLQEPYPIIMHVYTADGGDALDPTVPTTSQTVFTAQIHVEERMRPDNFVPLDNTGTMSVAEIQENLRIKIENWENDLSAFYGTAPVPTDIECYYDTVTQQMYSDKSDDTYSNQITGSAGVIYQDHDSGILYFYENDTWVEWTVSGAINYCMARADACDAAKESMDSTYHAALDTQETALENTLKAGLGDCVIRTSTTVPSAADYATVQTALANQDLLLGLPVITFVLAEG